MDHRCMLQRVVRRPTRMETGAEERRGVGDNLEAETTGLSRQHHEPGRILAS